nr:immunoglobulin heavy chain junction region [Macaca mulatta]MOW95114.1 immunoglobulin heavy chain junction region [Macaca mulatta]MOW95490.1 immunoglobulin heavy chain junction region [Macaca mulatta]MOW96306.1 immunoglobulin heavy chain junction region [Macaca mulatta]
CVRSSYGFGPDYW